VPGSTTISSWRAVTPAPAVAIEPSLAPRTNALTAPYRPGNAYGVRAAPGASAQARRVSVKRRGEPKRTPRTDQRGVWMLTVDQLLKLHNGGVIRIRV
jgi:hypothetical protein